MQIPVSEEAYQREAKALHRDLVVFTRLSKILFFFSFVHLPNTFSPARLTTPLITVRLLSSVFEDGTPMDSEEEGFHPNRFYTPCAFIRIWPLLNNRITL